MTMGIGTRLSISRKRITIITFFVAFILLSVNFSQVVPTIQYASAEDTDGDGLDDTYENDTYYTYYKNESTMYFNSEPGMNEGEGWVVIDCWMNIIRPHFIFAINVTTLDNQATLYIVLGNETAEQDNISVSITSTGFLWYPDISSMDDLTLGYYRVRICSGDNFTLDLFKMQSHTAYDEMDTDDDGLDDGEEDDNMNMMTDEDETNPLMEDTDGDGLNDGLEVNTYSTNPLDTDSDDDGLTDGYEVDNNLNPLSNDTDSDWLSDYSEINTHNTQPDIPDTDSDGLTDGQEVITYSTDPLDTDTDNDGLSDYAEVITYSTDPLDSDSDDDGLSDGDEVNTYSTDPNDAEEDTDEDGLVDCYEILVTETDHDDTDSDDDGLWDGYDGTGHYGELSYHNITVDGEAVTREPTDPNDADSDGDSLSDYLEVVTGWDVTTNGDTYHVYSDPNERISNPYGGSVQYDYGWFYDDYYKYTDGTDPWISDTDGDGYKDAEDKIVFRTNAEDDDEDGQFEYNESGVWISLISHYVNSMILDTYDYYSTVQITFNASYDEKSRTSDDHIIWRYYYKDNGKEVRYIFYEDIVPEYNGTINAWKFIYSTDNDFTINEKLNGTYNYKFLKDPVSGYTSQEIWLNNTIADTDNDGMKDQSEFLHGTDPFCNDTDEDGLSDYMEIVYEMWYYYIEAGYYLESGEWIDTTGLHFYKHLSPLDSDFDNDGLLDGEEFGIKFRTNSFNGTYDNTTWISINNGSLLYSSSLWMSQFSGYGDFNASIKTSIQENYTRMTAYGYAGEFTDFTDTSELGYVICNNTYGHLVYSYNFSTIFIDENPTDGSVSMFNLSSDAVSSAETSPFSIIQYTTTEIYNCTFWTNPFCNDSDGDDLSDYDEVKVYGSYALDRDCDDDGLTDYFEVHYNSGDSGYTPFEGTSNETDLNPFNTDTDGDGLWDGDTIIEENITLHMGEVSNIFNHPDSDPLNNDTDDDGLLDGYIEGGEKARLSYRSTKIVPINESLGESRAYINFTSAFDGENSGQGYLGYMNISFDIAINYEHADELTVKLGCIWEDSPDTFDKSWTIPNDLGPGNTTFFATYTLHDTLNYIQNWYTDLDISIQDLWKPIANGHWYLEVEDTVTNSSTAGSIERFEMHIEYRTDPTDSDSDDDGLNDCEEATFGDYGWITNPWSADTDWDSLDDYDEVTGTGDALKPSNPTSNDTDADGTEDGDDLDPTGNAYFKFEFSRVEVMSGVEKDGDSSNPNDIYPVITYYNSGDFEDRFAFTVPFNVENKSNAMAWVKEGQVKSCPSGDEEDWTIVFDVPDFYNLNDNEKWFYLGAYDEDGDSSDDDFMKLNSSSNDNGIFGFAYDLDTGGTQSFVTNVQSGTEARFWFNVSMDVVTKKNTLLILPDNDTCSRNTTTSRLQFMVPEMSFSIMVVYVNDEGNSEFDAGINTILIPTPILFGSQFWNMTNSSEQETVTTDLPNYMVNANWTMFNNSEMTSQIQFIITFDCSASNASELLGYLLHNATGNKTFWFEDITEDIYMTNLPTHVVNFAPADYVEFYKWAGDDNHPSYDNVPWFIPDTESRSLGDGWNALCEIGGNINGVIEDYTGIDLFELSVFVFKSTLDLYVWVSMAALEWGLGAAKSAVNALEDIKDAVQDALNFMVEWIYSRITAILEPVFMKIMNGVTNYRTGIMTSQNDYLNKLSWFDYNVDEQPSSSERENHYSTTKSAEQVLVLSLIGLQDYSDELDSVMNLTIQIITPFNNIFSPVNVVQVIIQIIGVEYDGLNDIFNQFESLIGNAMYYCAKTLLNFTGIELNASETSNCGLSSNAFSNYVSFNDDPITTGYMQAYENDVNINKDYNISLLTFALCFGIFAVLMGFISMSTAEKHYDNTDKAASFGLSILGVLLTILTYNCNESVSPIPLIPFFALMIIIGSFIYISDWADLIVAVISLCVIIAIILN